MANVKLSQIASGGAVNAATDQCVTVRSGTTDVLTTPVSLGATQTWTGAQTFVAPILGAATATSINKVAITAPATSATLTIANGATLTASATATVSGTNTGDQTITLTGNVTGSGTGSFATTIANGAVTNAMLAGSIAASNLVGTDIAAVGTITTGTWNGTMIAIANGGTGQTTAANAINALLPSQTGQSGNFLTTNGTVASWAAGGGGGSGTVTSIIAGSGLSGGTITTTGTISLNVANANTWTAIQTVSITGTANTNSDAVILAALGTATAPTTQFDSGSLRLTCSAWKSNATASAQLQDWIIYAQPVTGATVTTSTLRFDYQNQVTGGGFFQSFGIVSTTSGSGSVLVGNKGGNGAIWLGSTSLVPSAAASLTGNGSTTTLAGPGTAVVTGTTAVNLQFNGTTQLAVTSALLTITSGTALRLGNAASTGLTAGVLAATTNASIVISDSTGQAYRIPCII